MSRALTSALLLSASSFPSETLAAQFPGRSTARSGLPDTFRGTRSTSRAMRLHSSQVRRCGGATRSTTRAAIAQRNGGWSGRRSMTYWERTWVILAIGAACSSQPPQILPELIAHLSAQASELQILLIKRVTEPRYGCYSGIYSRLKSEHDDLVTTLRLYYKLLH